MTAMYHLSSDNQSVYTLIAHFKNRTPRTNHAKNFGIDLGVFEDEGRHLVTDRYAYVFRGSFKEMLCMITFIEALF